MYVEGRETCCHCFPIVQLGPSPNTKPKPWFWTKANTKFTLETTHHTNFFPRKDCPRVMKIRIEAK